MWDTVTNHREHLTHDLPCGHCGHAPHHYLPCDHGCSCPGTISLGSVADTVD